MFSTKPEVLVCPRCGSAGKQPVDRISSDMEFTDRVTAGFFKCLGCGYEGPFSWMGEEGIENLQKESPEE